LDETTLSVVTKTMAALNKTAAEVMLRFPVSACTDITGFGLLGHLIEMTSHSHVEAEIHSMKIPLLPRVEELAAAGIVPGGTLANLDFVAGMVCWRDDISELRKAILCDAQTSGGLLIAVPEKFAVEMASEMTASGVAAVAIGRISGPGPGRITII
jgi:selenide,water dikinase